MLSPAGSGDVSGGAPILERHAVFGRCFYILSVIPDKVSGAVARTILEQRRTERARGIRTTENRRNKKEALRFQAESLEGHA